MPVIIKRDLYISSENSIVNKIIYYLNSNNLAKTPVLPHNSANPLKKFVRANYLIYLVKALII